MYKPRKANRDRDLKSHQSITDQPNTTPPPDSISQTRRKKTDRKIDHGSTAIATSRRNNTTDKTNLVVTRKRLSTRTALNEKEGEKEEPPEDSIETTISSGKEHKGEQDKLPAKERLQKIEALQTAWKETYEDITLLRSLLWEEDMQQWLNYGFVQFDPKSLNKLITFIEKLSTSPRLALAMSNELASYHIVNRDLGSMNSNLHSLALSAIDSYKRNPDTLEILRQYRTAEFKLYEIEQQEIAIAGYSYGHLTVLTTCCKMTIQLMFPSDSSKPYETTAEKEVPQDSNNISHLIEKLPPMSDRILMCLDAQKNLRRVNRALGKLQRLIERLRSEAMREEEGDKKKETV